MQETPSKIKPYRYFDTPDGQDTFKKLGAVLKPTTLAALGISTADVLLYSHPQGYMRTFGRYVAVSTPIIGVTSTFVLATNLSASIRKKEDKINWFIGGASAGGVLGVCFRSAVAGSCAALALGICAVLKKYAVENNVTLVPLDTKSVDGNVWFHDLSLTKERSGNWTAGQGK